MAKYDTYTALAVVHGMDGKDVVRTAPAWKLEAGDEVIIETLDHPYEIRGKVVCRMDADANGEEVAFLKALTGEKELLKVLRKVTYSDLWPKDEGVLANG